LLWQRCGVVGQGWRVQSQSGLTFANTAARAQEFANKIYTFSVAFIMVLIGV
jgi:hypothetical protein